jgi:hypothetical protein
MAIEQIFCPLCGNSISILEVNCPHDNTPLPGYPNVRLAQTKSQTEALENRYQDATAYCKTHQRDDSLEVFNVEIKERSQAVLSLGYTELRRLAENPKSVFSTFYERVKAGLQIPSGGKWDILRGIAEHSLYQHQKDHIRFAALSTNGIGVLNYGDCHVTLKTPLIEQRTSVFEDNNVVFTVYSQNTTMAQAIDLPPGHLTDWPNRNKLAVAKLATHLLEKPSTQEEIAGILIDQGATTADDRFIELHIFGPITVLTIEKVRVTPKKVGNRRMPKKAEVESLRASLKQNKVLDVQDVG